MTLDEQIAAEKKRIMGSNLDLQINAEKERLTQEPELQGPAAEHFKKMATPSVRKILQTQGQAPVSPDEEKFIRASQILNAKEGSDEYRTKRLLKALPGSKIKNTPEGKMLYWNGKKFPVFTPGTEGYPSLNLPPFSGSMFKNNPYTSKTIKGKNAAMAEWVKKAKGNVDPKEYVEVTRDYYMNPVINIKKTFGGKIKNPVTGETVPWKFKKGKYYLGTKSKIGPNVARYGLPALAGGPLAGFGLKSGMAAMGAISAGNEYGYQKLKEQATGEGADMASVIIHGALGAVGEGAGRAVFHYGGKAINKLRDLGRRLMGSNNAKVIDKSGNFTPEFIETLKKKGIEPDELSQLYRQTLSKNDLKNLTNEQALKNADFVSVTGKSGTAAQTTGDFAQHGLESEILKNWKEGNPLREFIKQQDENMFDYLERLKRASQGKTVASDVPAEAAGDSVITALKTDKKQASKAAGKIYKKAYESAGADTRPTTESFRKGLEQVMTVRVKTIPKEINKIIGDIYSGKMRPSVSQIEKDIIPLINELSQKANPAQLRSLTMIKSGLERTIARLNTKSGTLFKKARGEISKVKGDYEANDIVTRIMSGKMSSEKVVDNLISSTNQASRKAFNKTVQLLKRTPEGKQALRNIRETVIQKLADEAKKNTTNNAFTFSAKKYGNLLRALERSGKLKILFSSKEREFLNRLLRVAEARVPPKGATNPSTTGAMLMNMLDNVKGGSWVKKVLADRIMKGGKLDMIDKGKAALKKKTTQSILNKDVKLKNRNILAAPMTNLGVDSKYDQ